MPTISEDQSPRGCEVRSAAVRLGLLRLVAGMMREAAVRRLETTQSAMARLEQGRWRTSLELIGRTAFALGCDMKRPV